MNPEVERLLDLAAELPEDFRDEFLEFHCRDPLVRAEVSALLQYVSDAGAFFDNAIGSVALSLRNAADPTASVREVFPRQYGMHEPSPGDLIGSYRIVSALGRGGMGSVYLAERADGELQQSVAVKLLRADGHRPAWRERFLRERQMLASLQHPAIVHLIDAGHTEDGRPFLVMEHVDGVSIDRYARTIPVRERLRLFMRVCEGVSHAHRRLIVHRDLKPSNILVDSTGQPKVLDFGIAKLLSEAGDLTQTAEQLVTPNYGSPEQLKGGAQSTATDVYSLGAVLYKLLTGSAPRENSETSQGMDAPPPSRVNPEVPRDLDFVVGKALRPDPEDRYRSVDDLAHEVRSVLEYRPVAARGDDMWYRGRRFLRRHWIPGTTALLILVTVSIALFVVNRERTLAERRFADVRQLAAKLFDIDVQVAQLQGGSKARQLIVDTALDYLKRLAPDVRMDPGLALELGTAYMRAARVQGVNISPNLGETEQAAQTAAKAQVLIDSVLASQPRNRIALLRSAQILHDRMILAGDARRDGEALRFADASIKRLNEYLQTGPLTASSDRLEAQQAILVLINVANRYMRADRFEDCIATAGRAIDIARATNWPTQAGAALMPVAQAHRARGALVEALRAIRESVRLLEPPEGEQSTGRLQAYGLALIREGQILGEDQAISLNQRAEAVECLERALKISEQIARRDPDDFQSQYRVFFAETKLAGILSQSEPARALALYDDGLRRLAGKTGNAGTLRNEAEALAASTVPLLRLGKRAEVRKRLDTGFERLKLLQQYPAKQIEPGSAADSTFRAWAEYEAASGRVQHGAAIYEQLLGLIAAGNPKPETSLADAVDLSEIYGAAAILHRRAGESDAAAGLESRRLDLWRQWGRKLPNNPFIQRQLEEASSLPARH